MTDSTSSSALQVLASGFTGAAITTLLNYFVRKYESYQEKRRQESRIAYALLTWVAPFVIMKEATEKVFSDFSSIFSTVSRKFSDERFKNYQKSEIISTLVSEILRAGSTSPHVLKTVYSIVGSMSSESDNRRQFNIGIEQLSKFPKEAIMYIFLVEQSEKSFFDGVRQLKDRLEDLENQSFQDFLSLWKSFERLLLNSSLLFSKLKKHGRISEKESDLLLSNYREIASDFYRLFDKIKESKEKNETLTIIVLQKLEEFAKNYLHSSSRK